MKVYCDKLSSEYPRSAMVFAEDIRNAILRLAEEKGPENFFNPDDIARCVDRENWQSITQQVKLVASVLVREGKIIATSSGKIVDIMKEQGPLLFRKRKT